ncbi:MAG: hypothetical protein DBX55_10450 [Verrucomicrobia bacterium]|nr:MAG: hypothetical protein DBX55_10450 [Verrucomicrobiota bacterium]
MTKSEVVKMLKLEPLACEGGWFRRTYESKIKLDARALGSGFSQAEYRAASAIYYLLGAGESSAMHALSGSDEIWHFCCADSPETSVELITVNPDTGATKLTRLGANLEAGEVPQFAVPARFWMGAKLRGGEREQAWALCATAVVPSFEYADFIKGDPAEIAAMAPEFAEFIMSLG